jgi:hypothetical protein
VLYIPLEALNPNDSISFVYTGSVRQQVIPGKTNDNEVIIHEGLEEGDEVMLVPPEDPESYRLVALDPEIIEKYRKEREMLAKREEKPEEPAGMDGKWKEMMKNMTPEQREAMKKKMKEGGGRKGN